MVGVHRIDVAGRGHERLAVLDEEQGLAMKDGVMSIPTMILFKDGEPAAAAVGAQPKSMLEKSLGFAA